jgi:cytochrome c-type biogenesis protein
MGLIDISSGLAFLAGFASFLSPCVFSLVPAYVGYLGGRSVASTQSSNSARWITLSHGIAFVLGFSIVFISLGIAASAIGGLLYDIRIWVAKIGGVVVVLFGLHMTGLFRIKFLDFDLRTQTIPNHAKGYLASFFMGIFFSAGWSPCVGPVLGAILTLALNGGSIMKGVILLSAYSAGLAIPFLIAAIGIGWATAIIKKYNIVMHYVEVAMGVILIIVGVMLYLGTFERLSRFGFFIDFGI